MALRKKSDAGFYLLSVVLAVTAVYFVRSSPHLPQPRYDGVKSPPALLQAALSGLAPQAPKAPSQRMPAASGAAASALDMLKSAGWDISTDADGYLQEMKGASLKLDSPDALEASRKFLQTYSRSLWGLSADAFGLEKISREESSSQVVYQQYIDGIPVVGTRVNMFFDENGSLVYAQSDLYHGPARASGIRIDQAASSESARSAVSDYYRRNSINIIESSLVLPQPELVFIMKGGVAGPAYRFFCKLGYGLVGDLEVQIDAVNGGVLTVKKHALN